MKRLIGALTLLFVAACCAAGNTLPQSGDVVFETSFDTPAERQAWLQADFATWKPGYQGTTSLCVAVSSLWPMGGHMLRLPLDLTRYRGCRLLFTCMAKADAVSKPPAAHLGLKYMLHFQSPAEGPFWQNENNVFGSFDWRPLRFTATIAPDATNGEINLGLQDSSGTAWFDAVRITVIKGVLTRPLPPTNPPPVFKGHALPRLRGVMSPTAFRDEDLRVLGMEWKANVIRWQMVRNGGRADTDRDLAEYDHWMDGKLAELDQVLDACHRYGLKVVVDLHSPPGGRYANHDMALFNEPRYQDHFVALWGRIARRYKGNPTIWGYDLVNEPVQQAPAPATGTTDSQAAQLRAAQAIRLIDAAVPIIIEADGWDSPEGYRALEPVTLSNMIYQVHMYVPGEFTHQGVAGRRTSVVYPGKVGVTLWNKDQLRRVLQPVRDFQLAYNVHIYVGEFIAIRWAPGAADYLRDCIDLFEEYGWDWTYHAYREWDGWSVEHSSAPQDHEPTREPGDRMRLLLEWFGKNVKPGP